MLFLSDLDEQHWNESITWKDGYATPLEMDRFTIISVRDRPKSIKYSKLYFMVGLMSGPAVSKKASPHISISAIE